MPGCTPRTIGETRRIKALGAQRDPAIGKGIADRRLAIQKGLQEFAVALGIGRQFTRCVRLGVG